MLILLGFEIFLRLYSFGAPAVLRYFAYDPSELYFSNLREFVPNNPILFWKLKSNVNTYYKGAKFSTNEDGFRSQYTLSDFYNIKKEKMAVFGRSITMGTGVEFEENWIEIVAKNYPQKAIYNFSISGYTFVQIEKLIYAILENHQFDTVIIPIFVAEWNVSIAKIPPFSTENFFERHIKAEHFFQKFFLYHFLKEKFQFYQSTYLATDWMFLNSNKIDKKKYIHLASLLPRVITFLNRRHVKTTFVFLPRPDFTKHESDEMLKSEISKWLNGYSGVNVIDASNLLVPFNKGIFPGDLHPDKKIHHEIARQVRLE